MIKKEIKITNPAGLHLRPAGALCKKAMEFDCEVLLTNKNEVVNAKSVLSVLGALVRCGDTITITCNGTDEEEAINSIEKEIKKFHE